jgi:hypothetical protein
VSLDTLNVAHRVLEKCLVSARRVRPTKGDELKLEKGKMRRVPSSSIRPRDSEIQTQGIRVSS